jgi:hypothetical protein
MQVTTHPAELCPTHESKFRAITVNWYEKVESICAKHGIKFLGSYDDHPAHTVYVLYDTPSMDTLMKCMMEPDMAGPLMFCSGRVFPVFDHKTVLAMIKK